ncbi:MAG: hypothetical protein LRY51_09350 [Geovibrio sp.]|nr:hypothetical protein [Geovibrio sp.]
MEPVIIRLGELKNQTVVGDRVSPGVRLAAGKLKAHKLLLLYLLLAFCSVAAAHFILKG